MVRLGEVCEVVMGQAPKGIYVNEDSIGTPLISGAGDFSKTSLNISKWTSKPTKISKKSDLILSIRATIGTYRIADQEYCLGRGVAALRAKGGLNQEFLAFAIDFRKQNLLSKARGATFLQVSKKDIQDLTIPLPPLGEQKRIAKILGKVAESTRKIEYELELLGKFPLFDWSWTGETQNLADVVIVRSGTVDPTLPKNRKLPLIAPDSIEKDTGKLLELKTCEETGVTSGKYHFHRGDVLYSKIRPYLNKVAIAPCDGLCSADMYALETKGNLTPETLQSILMSRQFLAYASQTSGRASIPKVNRKNLLAYEVPKLSDAQIFEITKKIQTVNKVKALLHQKLVLLKELQRSLSVRAFAGEL